MMRNVQEKRTRVRIRMSSVADGECLHRNVDELGLGFARSFLGLCEEEEGGGGGILVELLVMVELSRWCILVLILT